MIIWLLGAGACIGQKLLTELSDELKLISIPRNQSDLNKFPFPDVVINLAASDSNADEKISAEANYDYPLRVLRSAIDKKNYKFKWIQVGSYFELEVPMGRIDYYSQDKLKFRKFVTEQSTQEKFEITSVILPHIFGANAKIEKLIPSAISSFKARVPFRTTSANQYYPILHVDDAVNAILTSIQSS